MAVNNNKYLGNINTYESFRNGVRNNKIEVQDLKVIVRKGTLAERVVSREISHEKIGFIDTIKNFVLSLFSKDYLDAKTRTQGYLLNFVTQYDKENGPFHQLYQYMLGARIKEKAPEDLEALKKEVSEKVNGFGRDIAKAEVQKFKEAQQAEDVKKAETKEKNKKANAELREKKIASEKAKQEQLEKEVDLAETNFKKANAIAMDANQQAEEAKKQKNLFQNTFRISVKPELEAQEKEIMAKIEEQKFHLAVHNVIKNKLANQKLEFEETEIEKQILDVEKEIKTLKADLVKVQAEIAKK